MSEIFIKYEIKKYEEYEQKYNELKQKLTEQIIDYGCFTNYDFYIAECEYIRRVYLHHCLCRKDELENIDYINLISKIRNLEIEFMNKNIINDLYNDYFEDFYFSSYCYDISNNNTKEWFYRDYLEHNEVLTELIKTYYINFKKSKYAGIDFNLIKSIGKCFIYCLYDLYIYLNKEHFFYELIYNKILEQIERLMEFIRHFNINFKYIEHIEQYKIYFISFIECFKYIKSLYENMFYKLDIKE